MNIKKLSALVLLFLGIIVLSACSSDATSEESSDESSSEKETISYENKFDMRLTDKPDGDTEAVNETIDVPKNSEKVVLLDIGVASTFDALDLEDNIIGLTKGDNKSSLGEDLETFKDDKYANLGGLKEPDYEKIAELDPEIIMTGARQTNKDTIEELKKAAPNAVVINVAAQSDNFFNDIKDMTSFIGQLYDKETEADELNKELDEKIDETNQAVNENDKTMMFIQTNGGDLSLHGPGGRYDYLYHPIGFEASGEEPDQEKTASHGNQISYEYISKQNPGIVLVMDRGAAISNGKDATKVDVIKTDVTNNVDAVKDDNIFELDSVRWYLNSGGHITAMKQLEEIEEILSEVK
ncbi:siderophore ABC transporter substrate-binding protein [Nosocomiicoccus ampullae]|uniref:Iron complex transport system substrate-binding protein n=1 Tax=Nosocomiicoccus ampullae TaxID=489910 RepID=A0A9Q2CYV6_9STAP|nr:ABC transporter substrate-binding protein [Nosocomiicoccus ampullae]MBB5175711.1 iron complex transport system substrate-binding protein [Nosocomiicoccus ampullae]QYA47103.1 ABC transporter substrate-binding protein [Nosocomiicoccus ampullae]QYA48734.1 ABC transporter substrate-binding protein [Nosocomiicoccus ampullae]